jgi:Ca-activated chloride channel homolog
MFTVKFRYKAPDGNTSKLLENVVQNNVKALDKTSDNFRFAAAVAEMGMLLRQSAFKGASNYPQVISLAKGARGEDEEGYRAEFIRLVSSAQALAKTEKGMEAEKSVGKR